MGFRFCSKCCKMTSHKWVPDANETKLQKETRIAKNPKSKPKEVLECSLCKRTLYGLNR